MKIAQVAPVWERVPPVRYGGIELIVSLLTEELVRRGHDVTLFATGDSKTKAKLSSVYHGGMREYLGNEVPDLYHVTMAFERSKEFDIIHNHAGYSGVSIANFISTPVLTTLHGVFTDLNKPFFRAFKDSCYYNSISFEQRRPLPELNYIGTVYNAIDIASFPFSEKKKDYFVYISRICEFKGSLQVIEVAKKAGVKLVMAGKIDAGRDTIYYEEKVKPLIDGEQIQYLGEVSEEKKRELFKDARAFLFPLQWAEPFGLVMVEAMTCGTPVIALPYGSVPEIIENGKSGFVVKNLDEMVKAIDKLDQIDPHECHRHVQERFSVRKMTDDYEAIYEKILKKEGKR